MRIIQEYETGDCDSAAQIDVDQALVFNRPSPVATRPVGMGTRSMAVAALHATGIRSVDPTTGFFSPA
jgi:hypothetical protein